MLCARIGLARIGRRRGRPPRNSRARGGSLPARRRPRRPRDRTGSAAGPSRPFDRPLRLPAQPSYDAAEDIGQRARRADRQCRVEGRERRARSCASMPSEKPANVSASASSWPLAIAAGRGGSRPIGRRRRARAQEATVVAHRGVGVRQRVAGSRQRGAQEGSVLESRAPASRNTSACARSTSSYASRLSGRLR